MQEQSLSSCPDISPAVDVVEKLDADISPAVDVVEKLGAPSATCKLPSNKYRIRYEGNSSKRWDCREILLDADWLESLYEPGELIAGKQVSLLGRAKGMSSTGMPSFYNKKILKVCLHAREKILDYS